MSGDFESYHPSPDGTKKARFSTYYERNPVYRAKAINIHGLICMICEMDFANTYGEWGEGFIHVHPNKPVSETGPTQVNPETDLSVVFPNCHAMIHRKRNVTLTFEDVWQLIKHRQ